MGIKGYLKGMYRRLSNPKPKHADEISSKDKFELKMLAANEIFKKGYAYGYYVFRIRVNVPDSNKIYPNIYELTDELSATDLRFMTDRSDGIIDIYISGTNEDIGSFIWYLLNETMHSLMLFDRSVVDYLETFPAIYWWRNEKLDDFVPTTTQDKDIEIKSEITELTYLDENDIETVPKYIKRRLFGYIFNVKDHYEFFNYYELETTYERERQYINGRFQWVIDILNKHPEVIKKISEYNNIVQDDDTESDEFDPDIDEII